MSDLSSSSDLPSASGSPGVQILAEEEDTRMDESHEDEISLAMDANEQDSTKAPLDNPMPVESSLTHPEPENTAEPGPEIEAEAHAQPGSQVEPQPELEHQLEAQPQTEQTEKENGTAGQPYSIADDNSAQPEATTAPPTGSRAPAAPSTTPSQQTPASTNGHLLPDKVTDGRVRQDPVPNKYVAKATKRDGNFGVMQMGHGRAFMDARDLAAKRSSEATQAAAEEAIKNGQNGMARRKHVWKPADPNKAAPPPPRLYAQYEQQGPNLHPQPAYYTPPAGRAMGPPPNETKNEQARLLTFLRSLHPVIVVDQLCKALAYFGGIPGAPAPQDPSVFPNSAKGNGQGGLLVGWLAEIFPPADFTKPPFTDFPHSLANMGHVGPTGQSPGSTHDPPEPKKDTPVKRPRGRPKGSKNSKFRKDKGAKKLKPGDVPPHPDGTPWKPGDVGTTVDLTQDTNSSQPVQPLYDATGQPAAPLPLVGTTPTKASQADPHSSVATTPGSRKRGRPKGSKSRPKPVPAPNLPARAGASTTAPGPQESPLASVARAANDATSTQYQSPYKGTPAQTKPSTQETTLSQHAQGWVDPPAPSPRESIPDPPVLEPGAAEENSKANHSRKRKQQNAPLARPTALSDEPPPAEQPDELLPKEQSERHRRLDTNESTQNKRRRTANGARPGTAATNTNSQSLSPVLSTSIASNNATPTPTSTSFGSQCVASRASTMRPAPAQMPQQQHQASSQQQQYQHQKQRLSPSLTNASQNSMQSRQGSYSQQPQQSYQPQQQQQRQQYAQTSYQNATNNNSFGGTTGTTSDQQFSYNGEYMGPNQYALSARRAMEDASSIGNQSVYGQFGRR